MSELPRVSGSPGVAGVSGASGVSGAGQAFGASGLPRDWLPTLIQLLDREPAVVRIVVAEVRGSTPREPGAFMLVGRDAVEGSIGGGQLEWEAIAGARQLLADAGVGARVNKIVLGPDVGQCCGGVVSVWLERFTRESLELLQTALEAGARGVAVLSSSLGAGGVERRVLRGPCLDETTDRLLREPRPCARPVLTANSTGEPTLIERLDNEFPAVWLYGAGHVGQALARILVELPLRLTWIDSRAELFPDTIGAGARILRDPDSVATVSAAPVGTYFIVMSHSHPLDYALCHALLERNDFAWLGLIGSMSKAARFRSRLTRAGLGADVIRKLVCPIGVDGIESKWPAAIAVAVAAQLMQQTSAVNVGRPEVPLERRGASGSSRPVRADAQQLDVARVGSPRPEHPQPKLARLEPPRPEHPRAELAGVDLVRSDLSRAEGTRGEHAGADSSCASENCATCGSSTVRRGTVTS